MQATCARNENCSPSDTPMRRSKSNGHHGVDGEENILLMTPNLITFSRILLIFLMGWFDDNYLLVPTFYMTNVILDYADGKAARYLNQCTIFGQVLDTILDHIAYGFMLIAAYAACESHLYRFYIWLQIFLKVGVHFFFMTSSGMVSTKSHKLTGDGTNPILTLFYNPIVFEMTIIMMTTFDAAQYVSCFTEGPKVLSIGIVYWIYWLSFPFHLLHMSVSVCKIPVATRWLVALSRQKRDEDRKMVEKAAKAK